MSDLSKLFTPETPTTNEITTNNLNNNINSNNINNPENVLDDNSKRSLKNNIFESKVFYAPTKWAQDHDHLVHLITDHGGTLKNDRQIQDNYFLEQVTHVIINLHSIHLISDDIQFPDTTIFVQPGWILAVYSSGTESVSEDLVLYNKNMQDPALYKTWKKHKLIHYNSHKTPQYVLKHLSSFKSVFLFDPPHTK